MGRFLNTFATLCFPEGKTRRVCLSRDRDCRGLRGKSHVSDVPSMPANARIRCFSSQTTFSPRQSRQRCTRSCMELPTCFAAKNALRLSLFPTSLCATQKCISPTSSLSRFAKKQRRHMTVLQRAFSLIQRTTSLNI